MRVYRVTLCLSLRDPDLLRFPAGVSSESLAAQSGQIHRSPLPLQSHSLASCLTCSASTCSIFFVQPGPSHVMKQYLPIVVTRLMICVLSRRVSNGAGLNLKRTTTFYYLIRRERQEGGSPGSGDARWPGIRNREGGWRRVIWPCRRAGIIISRGQSSSAYTSA